MYKYVLHQRGVGDLCATTIESILEETARSVVYDTSQETWASIHLVL